MIKAGVALSLLLAGCVRQRETVLEEAARLRASVEKFSSEYRQAIDAENRLRPETLAWLRNSAMTASRAEAARDARSLMDRWATVYFVPRWMHEKLRYDRYSSTEVRAMQARVLGHLKRRYFELHDYQRYAQYASESAMHYTPVGYLPAQLKEFELRLEERPVATDELGGMLAELPGSR
jgi:hypothetical protein